MRERDFGKLSVLKKFWRNKKELINGLTQDKRSILFIFFRVSPTEVQPRKYISARPLSLGSDKPRLVIGALKYQ